ncbi:hypothetical protein [Haloarchaeobius sp. TZWSO28]|uniref:hypothetical protein n=1 Tax=Haloarchaeobius sp. TZWSO28 TaxID=3446119 RepID=UPI003EC0A8A4
MGSWTSLVIDPGDRDPEAVVADLEESVRRSTEILPRDDDGTDLRIGTGAEGTKYDGQVLWYTRSIVSESDIMDLHVPCRRVLVMQISDTAEGADCTLYEWVDDRFVRTDCFSDETFGRTSLDYFAIEHGIQGDRRV